VEYEQAGNLRAEYGKALINNLAADLGLRHGKSFSRSNLVYMRLLYQRYPISQKASHQLSWSHRGERPAIPARPRSPAPRAGAEPARGGIVSGPQAAVQGELGRVSQTLSGRIRQLAERYATPLPQLIDDVATLAARVDAHLKKMGAVWK